MRLISYVEAHVALATLAASTTIAGWSARRHGAKVPVVVLLLGALGTVAVIPLVLFPTTFAVFLVSNQLRLLWLVVTAVWLIVRRGNLTAEPAEPALVTSRHPQRGEAGCLWSPRRRRRLPRTRTVGEERRSHVEEAW